MPDENTPIENTADDKIVRRKRSPNKNGPTLKSLAEQSDATDSKLEGLDTKLGTLESSIIDLSTTITGQFNKLLSAKNNPTSISQDGQDSRDVYQHLDERPIEFSDNGPDSDVEVVRPGLCAVGSMEFKAKADQMRFDNEKIQIMVMSSQASYPDHTFNISVNGVQRLIARGHKQWLPRNYVEVLLRAKTSTYGNIETRNHLTNELTVKNPETKSHRYPLQILKDTSPYGQAWLERVSNDMRA